MKITKKQFNRLPLPEIPESNESKLCQETCSAILNHDEVTFNECITNKEFNINERFDTSYMQRENYLNYALRFKNYYAANRLLEMESLELDSCDKQDMLLNLTYYKRFILLLKAMETLEGHPITIKQYVSSVVSQDYDKVIENNNVKQLKR